MRASANRAATGIRHMYLEDGAEEAWQPSESPESASSSSTSSSNNPPSATPLTEEEMVRRILTGYDSTQATALSASEGV